MESMEDRTMRLSDLPPFPQPLEIAKERRLPHFQPHDDYDVILTVLTGEQPCHFYRAATGSRCPEEHDLALGG